MNVFKKIKNVLFDVEEEIPTIGKETEIKDLEPIKSEVEKSTIKEVKVPTEELFKTKPIDSKFNFPIEMDDIPQRSKGYKEYNRDSFAKNKFQSRDLLNDTLTKPKKTTPFKATPVISPVYGILDQNYSKDDVIVKTDIGVKGPDLDEVRKKAYGEEKKEGELKEEFDKSLKTLDSILMEEPSDELIKDPNDHIEELPKKKQTIPDEYAFINEAIERESKKEQTTVNPRKVKKDEKLENTIESDLFNLIDSMYEDKESEE